MWSFVWSKKCIRWVWIALCRRTRQVVAYFIGDRSGASCRAFWERIPASYKRGFTFSDYWKTYKQVIQTGRHFSVGKESGETNHVERWNNTLRQRIGRFVRKTLSFSKGCNSKLRRWRVSSTGYQRRLQSSFSRRAALGADRQVPGSITRPKRFQRPETKV